MDNAEILALLAQTLARGQTGHQPEQPLAARLCDACTEILGAQAGMMSLSSASERLTMRIAEPAFAQIEDLQAVLGEGPALLAFAEGRTVVTHLGATADLSTELTADVAADGAGRSGSRQADASAFPMFTAMAAAIEGAVSVYAVPMRPLGRVIGVLTLYLRGDVRGDAWPVRSRRRSSWPTRQEPPCWGIPTRSTSAPSPGGRSAPGCTRRRVSSPRSSGSRPPTPWRSCGLTPSAARRPWNRSSTTSWTVR
nr:hypothetical protein GCM10025730_04400 [Promicromonospora thailandica]